MRRIYFAGDEMRGGVLTAILASGLAVCLGVREAATDNWVVRLDGVGPIKIGMTLTQLNAVLRGNFNLPPNKEDQGCFYINPNQHPQIALMIENGHLVRVEVDHPGTATAEGIQVGDLESRALGIYDLRLKVEPRAYVESEGHFLTACSPDGRYGVRFETEHGKITAFYAGTYAAIQCIEGCE